MHCTLNMKYLYVVNHFGMFGKIPPIVYNVVINLCVDPTKDRRISSQLARLFERYKMIFSWHEQTITQSCASIKWKQRVVTWLSSYCNPSVPKKAGYIKDYLWFYIQLNSNQYTNGLPMPWARTLWALTQTPQDKLLMNSTWLKSRESFMNQPSRSTRLLFKARKDFQAILSLLVKHSDLL